VANTVDEEGQTLLTAAAFGVPPLAEPVTVPSDAPPGSSTVSSPALVEEESEGMTTGPEPMAGAADEILALFSEAQASTVDILTGLGEDDLTSSPDHWEGLLGGAGAERFVLASNAAKITSLPDLIIGFSVEQKDKILQISGVKNLDEICFESLDSNQDGLTDSALIRPMNSAKNYGAPRKIARAISI